ncbi:MAG: DEAD/DEAH box helicase [Planctomycetaceae bacterium]|nr:DEAD/DEAH box helicase [Planctomycetaceae bacterium]
MALHGGTVPGHVLSLPPQSRTTSTARAKASANGSSRSSSRKLMRRKGSSASASKKLSRTRKPDEMSLEEWQRGLRREYGRDQAFQLANIGNAAVFSDFLVTNPQSKNTYRVAIHGTEPGDSFCTCPDFATNALGTCKHIEFTLAKLEARRGGRTALQAGYQPAFSEVWLQYGAARQVRFRPGTECPPELARLALKYFSDELVLRDEAFSRFESFLAASQKIEHELKAYDDALAFIAEVRDRDRRKFVMKSAFPRGIRTPRLKRLLKVPLYDYQLEGALFAATAGRSLIGDEMGLGKTIQAIAAAEIMAQELGVERVLIVCPTSLKHQWEREIEKFTGRTAQVIGGLRPEREEQFRGDAFFKITNYDTVHRDLDLIAGMSPDLVILDEAQRIKNWTTRAANAVKKIQSPYCVVLTGTPLENRLEELVSIVQVIDRHRLGPTYRFLHDHQVKDENGRVVGYKDLDQVGRTLEPILIRRQKKEVLNQLPERLEKNFFVPMTPQQKEHHDQNRDTVARVVQKWRKYGFLTEADQRRLMISLQNMRMSCNSTFLLDRETDFSHKPDELMTLLGEHLERPESKAIVFSQWTGTHELAIRRFMRNDMGHVFFHGGVESRKRKDLVERFRNDPACRVFLSTDAGGVGLNLQFANAVINMDLPWNPAVLEQRIGRAHRLGQTQPVQVVNFVSQGTIEEGMLSVLKFKKSLFAGVLDGGEKEVFLGGSRLTKFLETVESVTGRIPEAAPVSEVDEPDTRGNGRQAPSREEATATREAGDGRAESRSNNAETSASPDPLQGLLQSGLAFLTQLAAASTLTGGTNQVAGLPTVRDDRTGRTMLQIPLPEPEVLNRALEAIGLLLEWTRG